MTSDITALSANEVPLASAKVVDPDSSGAKTQIRTIKVEETGDFAAGNIKPKIRIGGRWLERAGFKPGSRVSVCCIAQGLIQIRPVDG